MLMCTMVKVGGDGVVKVLSVCLCVLPTTARTVGRADLFLLCLLWFSVLGDVL